MNCQSNVENVGGAVASSAFKPCATYLVPKVSIYEDSEGFSLVAEMPGVCKDGVSVTAENGELTLSGKRASGKDLGRRVYGELPWADYHRVLELDPSIDVDKISAKMEQGVLSVKLPKSSDRKPRKILVSEA